MLEIPIAAIWRFPDPRVFFPIRENPDPVEPIALRESFHDRLANLWLAQREYDQREYTKFLRRLDPIDLLTELGFEDDAMALYEVQRVRHAAVKSGVTQGDPSQTEADAARVEAQRQKKKKAAARAKKYRQLKRGSASVNKMCNEVESIRETLKSEGVAEEHVDEQAWKVYFKQDEERE